MEKLPIAIVHSMVYNKKANVQTKLKYQEKVYMFSVYEITKADIGKINRVDGVSVMRLGAVKENNQIVELNAKSIDIDQVKTIIKSNPFVAVLSIPKGTNSDTGSTKYNPVNSIAFDSMDLLPQIKRESLKQALATKEQKDSQKNKVYSWEGNFFRVHEKLRKDDGWRKTTLPHLKKLGATILMHFRIPQDKVHITAEATKSKSKLGVTKTFRDDASTISPNYSIVNVFDFTKDTLIHELAHVISTYKYPKKGQISAHGAEFCGVYAHILGLFGDFDEDTVIKDMKRSGLKVDKYTQDTAKVGQLK